MFNFEIFFSLLLVKLQNVMIKKFHLNCIFYHHKNKKVHPSLVY